MNENTYLNILVESSVISNPKLNPMIEGKTWDKVKKVWRDHKGKIITGTAALAAAAGVGAVSSYNKKIENKAEENRKKEQEEQEKKDKDIRDYFAAKRDKKEAEAKKPSTVFKNDTPDKGTPERGLAGNKPDFNKKPKPSAISGHKRHASVFVNKTYDKGHREPGLGGNYPRIRKESVEKRNELLKFAVTEGKTWDKVKKVWRDNKGKIIAGAAILGGAGMVYANRDDGNQKPASKTKEPSRAEKFKMYDKSKKALRDWDAYKKQQDADETAKRRSMA